MGGWVGGLVEANLLRVVAGHEAATGGPVAGGGAHLPEAETGAREGVEKGGILDSQQPRTEKPRTAARVEAAGWKNWRRRMDDVTISLSESASFVDDGVGVIEIFPVAAEGGGGVDERLDFGFRYEDVLMGSGAGGGLGK